MEGTVVNQNAFGEFWYAYNDKGERVVDPGQYTQITAGVVPNELDPSIVTIDINENGYGGSSGAYVGFVLGPAYVEGTSTVMPFAGVGTMLSDNLGFSFYNAQKDGATGVYFDYMTDANVKWVRFEVKGNQVFPNAGLVHHCLAPGTGGQWMGVSVPFTTGLFLPDWDEVALMTPAEKILNTQGLVKLQWAVQDEPGMQGAFAIDNVHMVGAAAITDVKDKSTGRAHGIRVSAGRSVIGIAYPFHTLRSGTVEITTVKGQVVASQKIISSAARIEFSTDGLASGIYITRLKASSVSGEDISIKETFSYLR